MLIFTLVAFLSHFRAAAFIHSFHKYVSEHLLCCSHNQGAGATMNKVFRVPGSWNFTVLVEKQIFSKSF